MKLHHIFDPLWGESTGHRWIPLTKGQWCGKRFHVVTSSCTKQGPSSPSSTNMRRLWTRPARRCRLLWTMFCRRARPVASWLRWNPTLGLPLTCLQTTRYCECSSTKQSKVYIRAYSRFAPSQWETSLPSNAASHWLGANLESVLYMYEKRALIQQQRPISMCSIRWDVLS